MRALTYSIYYGLDGVHALAADALNLQFLADLLRRRDANASCSVQDNHSPGKKQVANISQSQTMLLRRL